MLQVIDQSRETKYKGVRSKFRDEDAQRNLFGTNLPSFSYNIGKKITTLEVHLFSEVVKSISNSNTLQLYMYKDKECGSAMLLIFN